MGLSHLSLLQMSFSGAVFILVIILLRAAAINRLPKKMFLVLWGIALLRLLVPFSIPSAVSVYSLISQTVDNNTLGQTPIRNIIPLAPPEHAESGGLIQMTEQAQQLQQSQPPQLQLPQQWQQPQPQLSQQPYQLASDELLQSQQTSEKALTVSVWLVIWCVGMILCTVFFAASYLRWSFKFRTSVPVHNEYVEQWLAAHRLRRPILVRQSDQIAAPLTYGVFHPVILLPKETDWENTEQLRYILLHEYVHIRRFDTVTKFITAIAVCIHWFNPLVWVMYVLFNRDLELSCDESVVRYLGIRLKSDYARVLISMEAKKSGLMPFYNNFSKNAIEERITSIMRIRKTSILAILAAVILIVGLTSIFVTSSQLTKGEDEADVSADETSLSEDDNDQNTVSESRDMANAAENLVVNIEDFYTTNMGDPSNLYYNYYHSVSDVDETSVYLGGVGGIYEINPSFYGAIYRAPYIAGAALYKNYIYSLEFNVTDNGMAADLIRIKKSGLDKEVLTQVSGAGYDLRIVDNILVISEYNMEDNGPVILFYAYTLDDEGNLTSDVPQDAYAWFDLPDGHASDMHYLIDPWFSTKCLGYSCFMKAAGVMDVNSVWIMREGQETAEEVAACHGGPLLTKDTVFYCDSNEQNLIQRSLDNAQETVLYEIPDGYSISLLTYDSEWVYFERYLPTSREGGSNELSSAIMRVNMQDRGTEVIYELQPELGQTISNFNVYGNDCYFILGAGGNRWVRCDLISGEVTTIDMDASPEDAGTVSLIDGVTMEVTKVSDGSVTLQITNKTDKNIQFGDAYYLEGQERESGQWRRLTPIIDNGEFHMVAYMLQDNSTANQNVNFEWLYGKLEPGKYRIIKEITDVRDTGDYVDYTYIAEFDVD